MSDNSCNEDDEVSKLLSTTFMNKKDGSYQQYRLSMTFMDESLELKFQGDYIIELKAQLSRFIYAYAILFLVNAFLQVYRAFTQEYTSQHIALIVGTQFILALNPSVHYLWGLKNQKVMTYFAPVQQFLITVMIIETSILQNTVYTN